MSAAHPGGSTGPAGWQWLTGPVGQRWLTGPVGRRVAPAVAVARTQPHGGRAAAMATVPAKEEDPVYV